MANSDEIVIQIPPDMDLTDIEIEQIADALRSSVVDVSEGARAAGATAKNKHVAKQVEEVAKETTFPQEKIVRTEPAPRK